MSRPCGWRCAKDVGRVRVRVCALASRDGGEEGGDGHWLANVIGLMTFPIQNQEEIDAIQFKFFSCLHAGRRSVNSFCILPFRLILKFWLFGANRHSAHMAKRTPLPQHFSTAGGVVNTRRVKARTSYLEQRHAWVLPPRACKTLRSRTWLCLGESCKCRIRRDRT